MRIKIQEIPNRNSYHYYSSIISKDEDISENIENKIKVDWLKRRLLQAYIIVHVAVRCDQQMPTKLKENFYKTVIRPTITYRVEC